MIPTSQLSGGLTEPISLTSVTSGVHCTKVRQRGREASRWQRLTRNPFPQKMQGERERGCPGQRHRREMGRRKSSGQRRC